MLWAKKVYDKGHNGEKLSRIYPFFEPRTVVTTGSGDIGCVVTEYGVAPLRWRSLQERARNLIRVAYPEFRDELIEDFEKNLRPKNKIAEERDKNMGVLKTRIEDQIAVITLDRPPANLFDYTVYDEFKETFQALSESADVTVVILNAAGKNFSMGQEMTQLQDISPDNIDEHYRIVGKGLAAIYTCKKPTIAAAQGVIAGAGLAAVAACDIIIAADDAHFMTPEIRAGIIGCTEFLELLLPKGIARYYAYTGKAIPAYEVYRCGGILEMAPAKEITARAVEIAEEIKKTAAPEELSCYKRYMNDIDANDLLNKFYKGKQYGKEFLKSPNHAELYRAFFEKRTPKFVKLK